MLCNYINAHCTEDLSLDELANEAGFSKYHFARLFTQARACDHCVILRRIKFNRRIRIKSRRMVSVMKVKFDRHKGRVFFTGEFYQELAGNSIRILFLYASHFQDRFDAVGTQRNLAAASFCAMFPRKIHAKDGRFIRRITDNAHTNAVNQPAEALAVCSICRMFSSRTPPTIFANVTKRSSFKKTGNRLASASEPPPPTGLSTRIYRASR